MVSRKKLTQKYFFDPQKHVIRKKSIKYQFYFFLSHYSFWKEYEYVMKKLRETYYPERILSNETAIKDANIALQRNFELGYHTLQTIELQADINR